MMIWQDWNMLECFKVFYVKLYVHLLVNELKWLYTYLQYCREKKEWKNKYWLCEYCDLLLLCIGWVYSMCNNFPTLFREPYYNCQRDVCSFWELDDWKQELSRTGCQGWRLSVVNQSFQLSTRWSLLRTWSRLFYFVAGFFFLSSFQFIVKHEIQLRMLGNRFQFRW